MICTCKRQGTCQTCPYRSAMALRHNSDSYMAEYAADAEFRRLFPKTTLAMCAELNDMVIAAKASASYAMSLGNSRAFGNCRRAAHEWGEIFKSMNAALIVENKESTETE